MRTCLYMGRCGDHRWHVCVRGDCGVAWQRDWKSGSYVELIRHVVSLQRVKTRRNTRIRQIKIRERLLAIILP
jgi:hypothetical protein